MKIIVNATDLEGNTVQEPIVHDNPIWVCKAIMVSLYRCKGLANILNVETNVCIQGDVKQIAEKARLGTILRDFEV